MIARCPAARIGPVAPVHPRHHLVTQVGVIPPGAVGIDELAAAVGGPRVHVDDDRRRRRAVREYRVCGLGERLPVNAAVAPHGEMAGVPLDHVDGRIAATGLVVVAGRQVDPERALQPDRRAGCRRSSSLVITCSSMRPASSADQGSIGPPARIEHRPPVCQRMLNGAPAARPAAPPGGVPPRAPPETSEFASSCSRPGSPGRSSRNWTHRGNNGSRCPCLRRV